MTHYNHMVDLDPSELWHPSLIPDGVDVAVLLPYFTRANYFPIGKKDGEWLRMVSGSSYPISVVIGWIFPDAGKGRNMTVKSRL